jgi:prolyl-tRNA synthetase
MIIMAETKQSAIFPTRKENYPEWYQAIIKAADLAEISPVRGCMVIKPFGYAIWENIQKTLDSMFKASGHKNAYFPLFIPLSFLEKEAKHVEGFAKECAVVTHHRLELKEGKLVPAEASKLEEPLIVRPTSETIIGEMFAKWIQSYRDLPLLINQWANVVRWEMRTRIFLRTAEFLWQEGHTAHASQQEAIEETMRMLKIYETFARKYLAMPVITGEKTESERFPGAVSTYSIEAMMQDKKALQAGTSHFLGQNFAKASKIVFRDKEGKEQFAWTTSWGASTRLIGALIMTHSDDDGLVLPPAISPIHVVIMPVIHKEELSSTVLDYCNVVAEEIRKKVYNNSPIIAEIDNRDIRGGEKTWEWIKKGVPIRLEIGPRDIANNAVFMARRDKPHKERSTVNRTEFIEKLPATLEEIQNNLYTKAFSFCEENTKIINSKEEFFAFFADKNSDSSSTSGGFALTHWGYDTQVEAELNEKLGVTIRCIPLVQDEEKGVCPFTQKSTTKRVLFAKAY